MMKRILIICTLLLIFYPNHIISQESEDNNSEYEIIKENLDSKNYKKAEKLSIEALKDNPENNDIRFLLGLCYIRQDKFKKAETEFKKITETDRNYTEAFTMLGNIYLWQGKNEKAISYYEKAELEGYSESLYINKARAHYKLGQFAKANDLVDKILSNTKENKAVNKLKDQLDLQPGLKSYKNENYAKAIPFLRHYLRIYPENNDIRFKLSKAYLNLNIDDSALFHLNVIYQTDSLNQDAITLLQNTNFNKKNYVKSLEYLNKLIIKNPNDQSLLTRKVLILKKLGRYKDAYQLNKEILKSNPENETASYLDYQLSDKIYPNTASLFYRIDFFDEIDPYNLAYFQYGRNFSDDKLLARMNVAKWGENEDKEPDLGYQIEGDYYMNFDNSYMYFNLGISNKNLFPFFRAGAEYYQSFEHDIQASLGYRFLNFDSINVNLFTASLSKYFGDFKLGYRYYFVPVKKDIYSTHVISLRKYFKQGTFLGAQYVWGTSHDQTYIIGSDFYQFEAQSLRLEFYKKINPLWSLQLNASYMLEKFSDDNERNRYSIEFMINRKF